MARRVMHGYNENLPEIPDDKAVLRAVAEVQGYRGSSDYYRATAQRIAWKLGIDGAHRLGRGAVAHSWTGTMAPALRISPRLLSLVRRGLLTRMSDEPPVAYRSIYLLTNKGREEIKMEGTRTDFGDAKFGDKAIWVSTDYAEEPENLEPVDAEEVTWGPGETVRFPAEHEMYPDEEAVVKAVGKGTGMYAGEVVYDVLVDGTSNTERITESDLEAD